MMQGFYTGINGIKSTSFGIDVLANNISNVNTVGFKTANTSFKDVFYESISSKPLNGSQLGAGSVEASSRDVFEQGSLIATDNNFDIAIGGKGFFGVQNSEGVYYTRNGAFKQDAAGNLVDSFGNFVLGTMNPSFKEITLSERVSELFGNISGEKITSAMTADPKMKFQISGANNQGPISAPKNLYIEAQTTTEVNWSGNLNTTVETKVVATDVNIEAFNFAVNEEGKINISGSVKEQGLYGVKAGDTIYFEIKDDKGVKSTLQATLNDDLAFDVKDLYSNKVDMKTAKLDNAYISVEKEVGASTHIGAFLINADGSRNELKITLNRVLPQVGDDLEFKAIATIVDKDGKEILKPKNGKIIFNKAGALVSNTLTSVDNNGVLVDLNLGSFYDPNIPNSGFEGLCALPDKKENILTQTNGTGEGFFDEYAVDVKGNLMAVFSNGEQIAIAKLALYNFTNEEGLDKLGNNIYGATANSGDPSFIQNKDGSFNMGVFHGSTLEQSNVNLGTELTNLIVTQKAYDASSKSITTTDQMIQKAINMKR